MKIALISDIHSNVFAFEAVVGDIKAQSVDLTVFLGDLVYGGLYPRACLSMLMQINPLIAIKGNGDGRFDEFDDKGNEFAKDYRHEIHCWVKDHMTEKDIQIIRAFKHDDSVGIGKISVGFYHGSPDSYSDRIYADDPDADTMGKFQDIKHSIAAIGHTHVRMHKFISGLEIINPGAVGISNDGDVRAGYGILTISRRAEFEQRNIEYPIERYVSEIENSDIPYKDLLAGQIKTGEPNKSLFRRC